jgi:aminoglycoside phosphotransferase (APT) family kinase protein
MNDTVQRIFSQRLGVLSRDQIQAALDRFGLGSLVDAEPVLFGNFGQNVFLTSTMGEYVLRGAPHYPWQFPKERFFSQLLHERTTAPVPWPYLLEATDDIFGWSYVIMPRMPGVQLSDPDVQSKLTLGDRRGIACAMGETLADLHTLTWPQAGEYDFETDTIQPLPATYAEWIISKIRCCLEIAMPINDQTTQADVEWVENVISDGHAALAVPFQPCFVMQDYKDGNVVADCIEGVWRISGVFDYMEPHFGDGEADLSRTTAGLVDEDVELARLFVSKYREELDRRHTPLRPGYAERFPVYMLLDRLIIWQFGQRHGVWWDPDLTLHEWANPFTSLDVF